MRAVLRFTPAYDPRIVDDPSLARELMVQRGALETVTPDQPIPVVVDHDLDRVVGYVTDMYVNADPVGGSWSGRRRVLAPTDPHHG